MSGAALLAPSLLRRPRGSRSPWRPAAACALFIYAAAFSLAYTWLPAGTGALLLFGCVQATMISAGLLRGERLTARKATGIATASAGVVILLLPGVRAPDPLGALLMAAAGVAWGLYSLLGQRVQRPIEATAQNFALAAVGCAPLLLVGVATQQWTTTGVALAVASGTLTSALGYILWYAALPAMKATNAAVVQLAVPALAVCGGAALLGEEPSLRLAGSAALTLGGIAVAITAPPRSPDEESAASR